MVALLLTVALLQVPERLPELADRRLNTVLTSPRTVWYDSLAPQAHQFNGPHFHAAFRNHGPADVAVSNPNREFPWRHTAGVDASIQVRRFFWLPDSKPIVWWRDTMTRPHYVGIGNRVVLRGVEPITRICWAFPVGAIVGEVLYMQSAGEWIPFEVRVRERESDDWAADVLRPFAEPEQMRDAAGGDLRGVLIDGVTDRFHDANHTFRPVVDSSIRTWRFRDDAQLTRRLLDRPLVSSLGGSWVAAGLIAPATYRGGLAGLDRRDCNQCHQTAGVHCNWYGTFARDWYGSVRGSSTVFSFHPADPSCIDAGGNNRPFVPSRRLIAAGLLEHYTPERHSDYRRLPVEDERVYLELEE